MFDQLVKRSDAVWIYSTGRFAECGITNSDGCRVCGSY